MALEIWTEKYRPEKLKDMVNQSHVVASLKSWVKEGRIPHMVFSGPAGCGKTTAAISTAKELFGKNWRENFLELNASDARGIDTIRENVKNFARSQAIGADFRIIFLDESDSLTPEAQQALRRIMEKFSKACRFILSCNYSSRLIEPISSRCSVFRFRRLSKKDTEKYLERIVKWEKLKTEDKALDTIYNISEGDLRRAVNLLQACAASGKKITEKTVYNISSQAKPEDVKEMLEMALKGKFKKARDKLQNLLIDQGLAAEDIVKSIHRELFSMDGIPEENKIDLVEKLGEVEFRLNQGATPEIQLESMLAQFLNVKKK